MFELFANVSIRQHMGCSEYSVQIAHAEIMTLSSLALGLRGLALMGSNAIQVCVCVNLLGELVCCLFCLVVSFALFVVCCLFCLVVLFAACFDWLLPLLFVLICCFCVLLVI